jgi:hypothetical protein
VKDIWKHVEGKAITPKEYAFMNRVPIRWENFCYRGTDQGEGDVNHRL